MKCPYGTGRSFTNERLYFQHVRNWPEIARVNGLNLDGTPQAPVREPQLSSGQGRTNEFESFTVVELRQYAADHGITLGDATRKADILELVVAG